MPTILLHEAKDLIPDLNELLDSIDTIAGLCERIDQTAEKYHQSDEDRNDYKGAIFELFVEFLINSSPYNPFVCISGYKPIAAYVPPEGIEIAGDYGIDGVGISTVNNKPTVVQCKYRSNPEYKLHYSEDKLGNVISQGFMSGLLADADRRNLKPNVLYVTTAHSIGYQTAQNALLNQVSCLSRSDLSKICDNQQGFWTDFKESIRSSRIIKRDAVIKQPRQHQREAIGAVVGSIHRSVSKGQVILPTGTGKTLIMSRIIIDFLKDEPPVIVNHAAPIDIEAVAKRGEESRREVGFQAAIRSIGSDD